MAETDARAALRRARRIVVKIGSKSLADASLYARLAREIAALRAQKRRVTLVSSGAIALGVVKLALGARPKEMALLQAAAAAGQSVLMGRYEQAFDAIGIPVAQVLLTHSDLADRARGNNARAALEALLEAGALPIINENDTVAVDEIRFGDNDQLASMVVPLVNADLLVLLSDVAGLLDGHTRVAFVDDIERQARPLAGRSTSGVGTGGMASKIEAARRAAYAGASVVVADARSPGVLEAVTSGDDIGTLFAPNPHKLSAKRHWIAFTLRPRGTLVLDRGAADAVMRKKTSVLAVGVLGVRGDFRMGDAVVLSDPDGRELGRGLARISAVEAARTAGKKRATSEPDGDEVVVHRDDLVVLTDP